MRRQLLNLVLAGFAPLLAQAAGGEAKKPAYLDCFPDKVMVYPGEKAVSWEELQRPGNAVEQLLANVESNKTERYVVILARPNSVKFYRTARRLVGQRPVDIGYDAIDDGNAGQWNAQTGLLLVGRDKQPATAEIDPGLRVRMNSRSPVYFECRDNEIFYVDKAGLDKQVQQLLQDLPTEARSGDIQRFIKAISDKDAGNKYYKVVPTYLLTAFLALEPRPGVRGEDPASLQQANSEFKMTLEALDQKHQFVVLFLRDSAFGVFRAARQEARRAGLETSWELYASDELLKFSGCSARASGQ